MADPVFVAIFFLWSHRSSAAGDAAAGAFTVSEGAAQTSAFPGVDDGGRQATASRKRVRGRAIISEGKENAQHMDRPQKKVLVRPRSLSGNLGPSIMKFNPAFTPMLSWCTMQASEPRFLFWVALTLTNSAASVSAGN